MDPVQSIAVASSPGEQLDSGASSSRQTNLLIIGLGVVALTLKLVIAFNTIGTGDVVMFYDFGKGLAQHNLCWLYQHTIFFNHPPLTAYFLRAIYQLAQQTFFRDHGLTFPLLLRLPGVVADLITVIALCWVRTQNREFQIPTWALVLYALSPVSIMVTGFHGNTDPVMVMFLVLAACMCLREQPFLCGICFALSCQIKIIPLLLLPILFFFWSSRRAAFRFAIPFALLSVAIWIQPLVRFPILFLRNVFGYSSYWGIWGVTYWLRMSHWGRFYGTGGGHLPFVPAATTLVLECLIAATVLLLAWRRRSLLGRGVIDSIGYTWIIFFVLSPGIGAQYMVWLAPFAMLLSPNFYGWLTAASSLFLFAFYNATAGGLPWYLALSINTVDKIDRWAPWSLWPWATLVFGMILLWKKIIVTDSSLRLVN